MEIIIFQLRADPKPTANKIIIFISMRQGLRSIGSVRRAVLQIGKSIRGKMRIP